MTAYERARAALTRLEEVGAAEPRVELHYHRLTDEQITGVLEALDTLPWQVTGHGGRVWIEAQTGPLSVFVYIHDETVRADPPVIARARDLLHAATVRRGS